MQQEPVAAKVEDFLNRHNLLGKTFIVGFSGGFDSMCLLDILSKFDIKLIGAHFNHGWRAEADDEEARCKVFCEARGIEFHAKKAPQDLKKTENDARLARYEFFKQTVTLYDADGVFTAHNMDDNAETVLYRIIKGTGLPGLQGISEVRDNIYRPILNCSRKEIEEYCHSNGLTPNVDSSNSNTKYKRNFIRHKVLPLMEEINPLAKNAINNLSDLAKLDETIIEEYLGKIISNVIVERKIDITRFKTLSTAVQQRIVYIYISNFIDEYDSRKIAEIKDFLLINSNKKSDSQMSLTTDTWIAVNNKEAVIYTKKIPSESAINIESEGTYEFGEYELKIEKCTTLPERFPTDAEGIAYADLSGMGFPLILRYGESEDLITPIGMSGKMVLKKYLSGKGIMKHLRATVPVITGGGKVLWVPFIGLGGEIKVKTNPTHKLTFLRKNEEKA